MRLASYFVVFAAIMQAGTPTSVIAETRMLLTSFERSKLIDHPLFGDAPNVQPKAYFEQQERGQLQVSLRASSVVDGQRSSTALAFVIKNLSAEKVMVVRPLVDVVDGGGQVVRVMTYKQIADAIAANPSQAAGQGMFFAYGSERFVAGAMAGYAITSILADAIASKRSNKVVEFHQKHWLRDEYRIPQLAYVDANVILRGAPRLPLTTRLTIGEHEFTFVSANSEAEAVANYARDQSGETPAQVRVEPNASGGTPDYVAQPPPATNLAAAPTASLPAVKPSGTDSYAAERVARQANCSSSTLAVLIAKGPGYESYSMQCTNGDVMMIRCEMGNCRALK